MSRKKKKHTHGKTAGEKDAPQKVAHDKIAAKKAAVLGTEKKSRLPLFVTLACAALVAVGALAYISISGKESSAVTSQTSTDSQATRVTYPVSLFEDGRARHFEYTSGDITIKYFILKSSDGVIRAAFDACDVCWPSGRGYYQEGDSMVCRNCGRRFASVLVNEVKGGCNPAPLNRQIEGENLVFDIDDILEGRQYFNFSGKA